MSRIVFGVTPYFGAMVLHLTMLPLLRLLPFFVLGRRRYISTASSAMSCCLLELGGLNPLLDEELVEEE
jgi:hypothetical protein